MDMTAVYTVETSLKELNIEAEAPVNVLLSIEGYLENPELSFGIEVPNSEDLDALASRALEERIAAMEQDETELYKNVFGLIVLGRFIPQGGGQASSSGGGTASAVNDQINNSVSQLLTSQLSRLSEDYLGGVEIDVGLEESQGGNSGVAGRDIDVALSKELFDDRLTVTVGGTTAGGQGNSGSGFAGSFRCCTASPKTVTSTSRPFRTASATSLPATFSRTRGFLCCTKLLLISSLRARKKP